MSDPKKLPRRRMLGIGASGIQSKSGGSPDQERNHLMQRKLLTACVALAAFAAMAVVPAIASATSPTLTHDNGTHVKEGTLVTATNTGNTVMTTSLGKIECTKAVLTGKVHKNRETHIMINVTAATFTGTQSEERCSGPIGAVKVTAERLPWCGEAKAQPAHSMTMRAGACTGAAQNMRFSLHSALAGTCTYEKGTVHGSFTTGTAGVVNVSEQEFVRVAGGGFCPATGKLDMVFDLYTHNLHTNANKLFVS